MTSFYLPKIIRGRRSILFPPLIAENGTSHLFPCLFAVLCIHSSSFHNSFSSSDLGRFSLSDRRDAEEEPLGLRGEWPTFLDICWFAWPCVGFCSWADLCITHASSGRHAKSATECPPTLPHCMRVHACVWFMCHWIVEECSFVCEQRTMKQNQILAKLLTFSLLFW